jgi:mono/diheme cytochrome c family protein
MLSALVAAGGWATGDAAKIDRGREVYLQACAACHGQDGNGNPDWESAVRPVPFSDCGTTAEPSDLWEAIVAFGGPHAGLDAVMPAFGEAYGREEIAAVVAYLRTFCPDADEYPPGDLNFRRLLRTGKAFPEQELVLRASHRPRRGVEETELEALYENRIGARLQYELAVPLRVQGTARGVGDVEIEGKRVLGFSHASLSILSAGLGVVLPTGPENEGSGEGGVRLAPFAAFGKGFGRGRTLFQARLGAEFPTRTEEAGARLEYAAALSYSFGPSRRAYVPAIELSGAYDTRSRSHAYSAWLELSKPLSALGHVMGCVGAQLPIRPEAESWRLEAYLLWDFGDGPFWTGW